MRKLILSTAFAAFALSAHAASDAFPLDAKTPPDVMIKTYAFLTRAQIQCKFKYWNVNVTNLARDAAMKVDDAKVKAIIEEGMASFDKGTHARGLKDNCAFVAEAFPNEVR